MRTTRIAQKIAKTLFMMLFGVFCNKEISRKVNQVDQTEWKLYRLGWFDKRVKF